MANDDWIKQLRDRLGDHTAPPPEGLWEGIERELARKRRHKRVFTMRVWAVAAAVLAAVVVGVGFYLNRVGNEAVPVAAADDASYRAETAAANAAKGSDAGAETDVPRPASIVLSDAVPNCQANGEVSLAWHDASSSAPETILSQLENAISEHIGNASVSQYDNGGGAKGLPSQSERTPSAAQKDSIQTTKAALSHGNGNRSESGHDRRDGADRFRARSRRGASGGGMWSVGLHAANVFAGESSSAAVMPTAFMAASAASTNREFVSVVPRLRQRYEKTKHHLPVQIGLTAAFALSGRLSLASGVVYTNAVSDFSKVNGSNEMTDRQTLHYIGVPLGLNCNVWQTGRFRTYVTVGGQADFNVKATMETEGVKAGAAKDRVQWSVGAAAGAQYDIVPQVGLYAEPGVKYYFNNHSQVENVFKSRPCNFSLQVGVRVNLK